MITAIVITRNEAQNIKRTINSLKCKEITEIIVVDSNSSDETVSIVRQLKNYIVKIIEYFDPPFTAARGRSEGVKRITQNNKYILFIDGDMEYRCDFTKKAIRELERDNCLAGLSGQMQEIIYRDKDIIAENKKGVYQLNPFVANGSLLVKRKEYFKTPGFNPNLVCDEENILYSYFKKNNMYFKRLPETMIIHHRQKKMSLKKIRNRIVDRKIDAMGISLYWAMKDKKVFRDFIIRTQTYWLTGLFWNLLPFYRKIWPIIVILMIYLVYRYKLKFYLFFNYSIYSFASTIKLISLLLFKNKKIMYL